jgi:hypothetical protein
MLIPLVESYMLRITMGETNALLICVFLFCSVSLGASEL